MSAFWSRVHRGAPADCWLWSGCEKSNGYGGVRWRGKVRRAHIVAYELSKGPTRGLEVRHLCHNRLCCNPRHLRLGTHRQNMRDMVQAGRSHRAGVDADAVRLAYKSGATQAALARLFDVSQMTISRIVRTVFY